MIETIGLGHRCKLDNGSAAAACAVIVAKRSLMHLHTQFAQRVMASKCLLMRFTEDQAEAQAADAD